jgi:hypothetical protein
MQGEMGQNRAITESFFVEDAVVAWKRGTTESYEVAATAGILLTREGPQRYAAGYYIMSGPEGEKYSMPPEKFAELKDDLGEGSASPKKIMKLAKLADHDGSVLTSWGEALEYRASRDYIVRHAKGDYGVVKSEIFAKTYEHLPPGSDPHAPLHPRPLPRPYKTAPASPARGMGEPVK